MFLDVNFRPARVSKNKVRRSRRFDHCVGGMQWILNFAERCGGAGRYKVKEWLTNPGVYQTGPWIKLLESVCKKSARLRCVKPASG
jgi:hypothetical protein